jgi:hypothetical protein
MSPCGSFAAVSQAGTAATTARINETVDGSVFERRAFFVAHIRPKPKLRKPEHRLGQHLDNR